MSSRPFTAVMFVLLLQGTIWAQLRSDAVVEGSQIIVSMTGELAREYAKATSGELSTKQLDGLRIETTATVEQRFTDGRVRIEHSSQVKQSGKGRRLITLSAIISRSKITSRVTPKEIKLYASPGSKDAKVTTEQTGMLQASLSDFKRVKLCTWALASEIGQ